MSSDAVLHSMAPVQLARHSTRGSYALAHPIGEGGTSIVWSSHRTVDGVELAIKMPKRRSAAAADALRVEARRLARLAPVVGVVPLLDVIDDRLGVALVLGLARRGAQSPDVALA